MTDLEKKRFVEEWDSLVGPIREKYRDTLKRIAAEKEKAGKKQYFQYEHPDLVREGIVFDGK